MTGVQPGPDGGTSQYVELEEKIGRGEHDAIWARWRFGRLLLAEREANGGRQLPDGRLNEICEQVGRSRAEISYRLQFAAKYTQDQEVSNVLDTCGSWHEIVSSALPGDGAHVGNYGGDDEWCTPPEIIEAVRAVLGEIDLDPASTAAANEVVRATLFHTAEDDGLAREWHGRVFLNPPYSSAKVGLFCAKLAGEHEAGRVSAAIVLVNNATETGWFQALGLSATALALPRHRIRFWHPGRDGKAGTLQGQALLYLGEDPGKFTAEFSRFGLTW